MRTMPNEQIYQIHPKDIPKFVPTEQTKLNRKTTKPIGTQALVLTLQHFFFVGFLRFLVITDINRTKTFQA